MTFRDAARILGAQITTADMARALGVSPSTVRQARMKRGMRGYRRPPPNWRRVLMKLAQQRGEDLLELVITLERELEAEREAER